MRIDSAQSDIGAGIRVITFFTGAGGLDLGFDMAGFEVVYATDIDEVCCQTLRANVGSMLSARTKIERADIRAIDPAGLPKNVDLVIGGPPCQTFSASGRRAGGAPGTLDARGTLFEAYCRIIAHTKPRAFVFENVRGILGTNKGRDWAAIVAAFEKIGYRISYRILDALDYGAPQQRERLLMVGHTLDREFLFPEPLYGPDSSTGRSHISAGEALAGIEDDEDLEALALRNGKYSHLLPLVPPGENYLYFTAKRGHPSPIFAYRSRFSDFLYKANPETPIKTLIASPGKYTGPFHWDNRYFSIREYMRLQGFPDEYRIVGDRADAIKQIGNSVSPKLAHQLAIAIAKQVFDRKTNVRLLPADAVLTFDKRKGQKAKATRKLHEIASRATGAVRESSFIFKSYRSFVAPFDKDDTKPNCTVRARDNVVSIAVHADRSKRLFATMTLVINQAKRLGRADADRPDAILHVRAYGEADHTVQTLWNAVDDWVIKSSKFHSLFELYGHFTEPHPVFEVLRFKTYSSLAIAQFAEHVVRFENCSRYFPRDHLTRLFGKRFRAKSFVDLVQLLRSYRFDIRCNETNIAIPEDVYMVSYPFTLPFRKQMNFSVRRSGKNLRPDGSVRAAKVRGAAHA